MAVLTGQIHRYVPLATEGEWQQTVDAKKPWTRVSFTIPFLFQYAETPVISLDSISYTDCSDLRVDKVSKTSFRCSVLYAGSWDEPGEVHFHWVSGSQNEN